MIPAKLQHDLTRVRIAVIGDVMLDRYWWGSVDRISPEAPVPIVKLERTSLVAGGAANVAANLKGLGVNAMLFGIAGNDADSELLFEKLADLNISGGHLTQVPGRPTTIKTRIVAHHQHVVRIDKEESSAISEADADAVFGAVQSKIDDFDSVIISDYAKGLLTDYLLRELIPLLRGRGKTVFIDPKRRDLSCYSGANVITPNRREAEEALSTDYVQHAEYRNAGVMLRDKMALDALLITEGENGMTLFAGGEPVHLEPRAQDVFDVTGAGDTVIATFAAAHTAGSSFLDSAHLANMAAGIVVGSVGTTTINSTDLFKVASEG